MSYNPFLDPNFKDNMEHFKRTGDSSVFRDSDYNLVESDKQKQSQSLEENSSDVQTDIISVPNTEDSNNTSPFDHIRHIDNNGQEYWEARELQGLLGYTEWRNFSKAIDKATESFEIVGISTDDHFVKVNKMVSIGSNAKREQQDYRLTRRACYTIAVCCDANKPQVAAAKQYFVVRTRQSELQQQPVQRPTTTLEKFAMVLEIEQEHDRRISALESCTQQLSQDMEDRISQLQKIRNDINELQNFNRIECPPAIISKRCNNINGIIYKLDSIGKLSFNDSKQLAYDIIFNRFNLDVEQELEKYKVACRRYYEHYKIYNGTPPKDILRPAAIEKLGWVSWVSIKKEIYDAVLKELKNYYDED